MSTENPLQQTILSLTAPTTPRTQDISDKLSFPQPHFIPPTKHKQREYETIKNILNNNEYNHHTLDTSIKITTTRLQKQ